MLKKKLLVILLIVIMLLGITRIVNATTTDGVITGDTVKLREGPNLDSKLVTLLSVDNKVQVVLKDGDWYKIKYKNYEGYVSANYIKVNGEVNQKQETNNLNTNSVSTKQDNAVTENITNTNESVNNIETNEIANNTINTNAIETVQNTLDDFIGKEVTAKESTNLQILPLINSDNIQKIDKGAKITVNDIVNEWAYVSIDKNSGWLRKDLLKDNNTETENKDNNTTSETNENITNAIPDSSTETNDAQASKVGYISTSSLNVRKSADVDSDIITTLTKNDKITVESVKNGWAKITTEDGEKGYVSYTYVSNSQVK